MLETLEKVVSGSGNLAYGMEGPSPNSLAGCNGAETGVKLATGDESIVYEICVSLLCNTIR